MWLSEFAQIFKHYDAIRNFLYYKLGDIVLAEDLAQEAFLKTWEKREGIRTDTAHHLLFTIANNLVINHFKSAKARFEFRLKEHTIHITQESPQYEMEKGEFAKELQEAIAALPEKQRTVFLMNRIDELTYREIAQRLEIRVKAVEKRMHEALEFLINKIEHKI
jgi:RNA polymerase sigma-70 factor (ECF subfamily)